MTYWVYKLTYDCGTAPHVRDGLLSLAICKPRIREGAAVGDVLFGFSGRSRKVNRGERLIYVAEVTEKLAVPGEYYERPEFRHRWDCIYERKGERLAWRAGSLTHEGEECRPRDLGPAPSSCSATSSGTSAPRARWTTRGGGRTSPPSSTNWASVSATSNRSRRWAAS